MRTILALLALGTLAVSSPLSSAFLQRAAAQDSVEVGDKPRAKKQNQTDKPDDSKAKVPVVTEEHPMSFWMAKKLDFSKSILESLTKGDFETLAADAEQMRLLGKLEGFVRRKNPDYRVQLRTFEFANQELVRQANRQNAEGATLAFNQLTTSCVACHVMLREGID